MALTRTRTTNDSDVWLLDRRTGTKRILTAHRGDVGNWPADFSPDGTKLLFISDGGREFAALLSHDLASGRQEVVLAPAWDVESGVYSRSGRYLVVSVDEDAATTSRLYDAATLQEVRYAGNASGRGTRPHPG